MYTNQNTLLSSLIIFRVNTLPKYVVVVGRLHGIVGSTFCNNLVLVIVRCCYSINSGPGIAGI